MSSPEPVGLSIAEAASRLASDGPNELEAVAPKPITSMVLEVAREPMFQMLVVAGALYLLLGNIGDALLLLGFVGITVGITVVQGQRTERALQTLRILASPRAEVVRGGTRMHIAGAEVVKGDLLVLTEGDRISADACLIIGNDLAVDESLLTGEAVATVKTVATPAELDAALTHAMKIAGRVNARAPKDAVGYLVYAGTLITQGHGLAQVLATGRNTEMGRIGHALGTITSPPTPLTLQIRRLVKLFSVLGLSLSVLVVALYGLLRGDWMAGLLAGITLAMSMLPEEFLLILTVFMAMGAWRLSQQQVLTRRAATIEALGSATVLCTDKTGTLTQNRMTIAELNVPVTSDLVVPANTWQAGDGTSTLPVHSLFQELLAYGVLASEREPFDAMDKAFLALGSTSSSTLKQYADWTLDHDYGLDAQLRVMTHVWRSTTTGVGHVAVKGAHESVAALCHLEAADVEQIYMAAEGMAARGLRVIAVARAKADLGAKLPAKVQSHTFQWLGLVGLADPLRPGVVAAVKECSLAGIRVVMITGDHPSTALAIAAQAGIESTHPARTGTDLATMDDDTMRRCITETSVFARVLPEQKLRIVEAFKANGQVVAMTGDGVNDAPSLKAAHIGVAMGQRGTDVAREASSLVLLHDDFGAIVGAVRLGRRIYDNLNKAMAFAFAVHMPIAGLSLLPLLFGLPLVFTPVHIAFLELLINPVCSIVFESEPEEGNVMQRPPRDAAAPMFSGTRIFLSLAQGALVLTAVTALFMASLGQGVSEAQARATAFTALVACSVALILTNRSLSGHLLTTLRRPNPTFWYVVSATVAMMAVVLLVPSVNHLFHFEALTHHLLAWALGTALGVLLVLELARSLRKWVQGSARRL